MLRIVVDKSNTIWVSCYKQVPVYFDEAANRFVSLANPAVEEISKAFLTVHHNAENGVTFSNNLGQIIVKDKKLVSAFLFKTETDSKTKTAVAYSYQLKRKPATQFTSYEIIFLRDGKKMDSLSVPAKAEIAIDNDNLYLFNKEEKVYKFSKIKFAPFSYKIDSASMHSHLQFARFSENYLNCIDTKDTISIFNKENLSAVGIPTYIPYAKCIALDRNKNLWVGTLDRGLLYYSTQRIHTIPVTDSSIHKNFLSLGIDKQGNLFAGNYYGQVTGVGKKVSHIQTQVPGLWIRELLFPGNNTFALTDMGYSINRKPLTKIFYTRGNAASLKSAAVLNDSIIILGSNAGLVKLNIDNKQYHYLNGPKDRALSLVKGGKDTIYYIGPKGLYAYEYGKNISSHIPITYLGQEAKLTALFYQNNMILAATINGDLLFVKNNKLFASIPNDNMLPANILCIAGNENNIWLGGKNGVCAITYAEKNNQVTYIARNISKIDGLPSNAVNDLLYDRGVLHVATEAGLAAIPANYSMPQTQINAQLINVKINQQDTITADNYKLKSKQNNITLQFAGVDLTGHFKNIQYAVNNTANWTNLSGNTLNLQLSNGDNRIYVRAIDVNNSVSNANLVLNFYIETPFFKTKWFWILVAISVTAFIFWLLYRKKLNEQRIDFEKHLALELQQKKITADLHDDIGATLSSLQLNSAVANQLINKDVKQAQKILDKIETQAKSLADKIGDIIWSMKPGTDEFMTIGSRIKNFANDILAVTNIYYTIHIDHLVNTKLKDINARKNIVLITKEAINNIAKYSNATYVTVRLSMADAHIRLTIQDNGVGFRQDEVKGNGLSNMRKRAEELGGTFGLKSAEGVGTTIEVSIPLVP